MPQKIEFQQFLQDMNYGCGNYEALGILLLVNIFLKNKTKTKIHPSPQKNRYCIRCVNDDDYDS